MWPRLPQSFQVSLLLQLFLTPSLLQEDTPRLPVCSQNAAQLHIANALRHFVQPREITGIQRCLTGAMATSWFSLIFQMAFVYCKSRTRTAVHLWVFPQYLFKVLKGFVGGKMVGIIKDTLHWLESIKLVTEWTRRQWHSKNRKARLGPLTGRHSHWHWFCPFTSAVTWKLLISICAPSRPLTPVLRWTKCSQTTASLPDW